MERPPLSVDVPTRDSLDDRNKRKIDNFGLVFPDLLIERIRISEFFVSESLLDEMEEPAQERISDVET